MMRLMPFTRGALVAAAAPTALLARDAGAQSACAAAETTLRAGDPRFAAFTPDPLDSMAMTVESGGAVQPRGVFAQHAERTRVNGAPAWLLVQRGTSPRGAAIDSIWVDARTWAPLRHAADTPGAKFDVAYRGGRVAGNAARGPAPGPVDEPVAEGVFDFSVTSVILGAVPLCPGSILHIAGYDPQEGHPRDLVYRIIGPSTVEVGGRTLRSVAVDATFDGRTVRVELDPQTHQELAFTAPLPNGAILHGATQLGAR